MGKDVRRAVYTDPGPVVKPGPGGKIDVAIVHTRARDGRHQQGITEHEFVIHRVGGTVIRISPEQRAQYWRSRAVTFVKGSVQIRQKALAQLEHVAADGFIRFTKNPRLLAARRLFRVIATEGLENPELRPAGKQLAGCVSVIAADIDARPAHAGDPDILQLAT